MTLSELKQKKRATVVEVGGNGALRQHFLDMGMIPGVEVMVEKRAPMGDPIELRLHG
ncbi:MAG: ferrous iron transport protein A, partial [Bacteroidaceae bacterium]|nr:ferrous iron transport protein A [Bacteroidaceae bacterium]